jgi:hypothetical protein
MCVKKDYLANPPFPGSGPSTRKKHDIALNKAAILVTLTSSADWQDYYTPGRTT